MLNTDLNKPLDLLALSAQELSAKKTYAAPRATTVCTIEGKFCEEDFNIGVSGTVDQGGEDAMEMMMTDDDIWSDDNLTNLFH